MELVRSDGIMKEQVEAEYKVRRDFHRKWGIHADSKINQRYDLQKIQKDLNDRSKHLGVPEHSGPYNYSGHGESYFVSKDMYKSLLGTCRCGRKKSGVHIVKCLQKPKNDYLSNTENKTKQNGLNCARFKGEKINAPTPGLSSAFIGWPQNRFSEWEQATRYISPKWTMPGHKIDSQPYSSIVLG